MKLYDLELSGNCYRVRLLLSLLGQPVQLVNVNLGAGENRQPWFLALNPRGQVPVLDDDGFVVWDTLAIMTYLARKAGGEKWLPSDPKNMARVMQWLAVMENETQYGLARARVIASMGFPGNLEEAQKIGLRVLGILEARLTAHDWLALPHCTLADIGCFPYVALARQGGLPLDDYPAILRWIARIKSLQGYVAMPGV
ncbi:MAG: glutathione S-transferase family protein [Rhodocyclaceae bacterium]|nr:glutathione S-transferase family protein [Rhodocyclaceae bacterium]